jgi:S-methylmethionine-dependent homocysteine/selenocysteine methylase
MTKLTIIDGGVGTEISRRGIPLHPVYWSAMAQLTHPELLLQIHKDYIDAGADIVSANTFMAARHVLAAGGESRFEQSNRAAVELAREARHQSDRTDLRVAGTLSTLPPLDQAQDIMRGRQIDANYRAQAKLLADCGVDLLIAEALFNSESASSLIDACLATGLPVWVGVSTSTLPDCSELMAFRQPGKLEKLEHETLDELLDTVCAYPVDTVGVMHTAIDIMPRALLQLQEKWPGKKLAYAKTGEGTSHDWLFEKIVGAEEYAGLAGDWVKDYGLDVIGGCCGMSPDHIRVLACRFLRL